MTALSRERIVAAKARADAATEGPWWKEANLSAWSDEDAEFITASREDVPVMADALLRVLDLHHEVRVPMDGSTSPVHITHYTMGCAICRGTGYPCATVRAVTGEGR